jgi:predicted metal-binding membrane protein
MQSAAETASGIRSPLAWATWGLAAAALLALATLAASPYAYYLSHNYQPNSLAGQLGALAIFLAGWTLMVLAMMLPTATSLLGATAKLRPEAVSARRVQLFTAVGFLLAWALVGYLFRAFDVLFHATLDSLGSPQPPAAEITASALVMAGAFQFSSLKHRCLTACRTPSSFVYRHWHGERPDRDALRIGSAYGWSCVGCCWALMLVMFALGTVNIAWMVAIGALTALEKQARVGPRLSAPIGVALFGVAALVVLGS